MTIMTRFTLTGAATMLAGPGLVPGMEARNGFDAI
jgi:hypothetical protein